MGTKYFNFIDTAIAYLRLRKVKKYLNNKDKILDFGCGFQAFFLKHVRNDIKYGIGIDYDVNNIKLGPNIKLLNYKFDNKLPLQSNFFDKVFVLAVIEHIEIDKITKLFKELKRVLNSNGQIIITTPTPLSRPLLEFLAYKLRIISSQEIGDHKKYYSLNDLQDIAQKSKLSILKYSTFQFGLNSICIFKKF